MFENKYSNFLTVLLVIVIIAIIAALAFGGYKVYQQFTSTKDANEYVNSFIENTSNNISNTTNTTNDIVDNNTTTGENEVINQLQNTPSGSGSSSSGNSQTYRGYAVIGTIEIPDINLSYPVLKTAGLKELEVSVGMLYGAGLNQVGNTLILGHNYRNGQFFANNKNLSKGDKIYITDLSGERLSYTIYDKFETTPNDTEFLTRNTNGAREISLQTCTDDGSMRLIILAKCDLDS